MFVFNKAFLHIFLLKKISDWNLSLLPKLVGSLTSLDTCGTLPHYPKVEAKPKRLKSTKKRRMEVHHLHDCEEAKMARQSSWRWKTVEEILSLKELGLLHLDPTYTLFVLINWRWPAEGVLHISPTANSCECGKTQPEPGFWYQLDGWRVLSCHSAWP